MKFNIELFEKAPIMGILRNINEETVKSARKAGKRSKNFDIDDLDLNI